MSKHARQRARAGEEEGLSCGIPTTYYDSSTTSTLIFRRALIRRSAVAVIRREIAVPVGSSRPAPPDVVAPSPYTGK